MLFLNEAYRYAPAELPFVRKINKILDSNAFVIAVTAFMLIANLFGLELVFYGFCGLTVFYLGLFGTDFRLLIPMFTLCYITPGTSNNPGLRDETLFSMERGGAWIFAFAGIALLAFLFRACVDSRVGFAKLKRIPRLLWGMLALAVAYLLSGIGSDGYVEIAKNNLVFAALQILALAVPFLAVSVGVRWERLPASYLPTVGLSVGIATGIQVVSLYFLNTVILEDGSIFRGNLVTGWGHYNNMAVLIAMAIPFAFYFVYKGRHVLFHSMLAVLLVAFAVASCSRAGILGACGIYVFCSLCVLWKSKSRRARISVLIGLGASGVALVAALFLLRGSLEAAFATGLESSARLELYKEGLKAFSKTPLLGSSFFHLNRVVAAGGDPHWIFSDVAEFNAFFPGRWHNTAIQLLASCGLVGLLAYAFHRYQTVLLVLKKPNAEKSFAAISLATLLALSLVDCHLFNIGPMLFYSCALAVMENALSDEIPKTFEP